MTVTSPDSTGSDNGAGGAGYELQHAYPGSTGSYGTQTAEVDMTTAIDNAALGSCTFPLFPLCQICTLCPFCSSRSRAVSGDLCICSFSNADPILSDLNDDTLPQYHAGSMPAFAPEIPGSTSMQGPSSQHMHPAPDEELTGLPPVHMYGNQDSPGYDGGPAHAHAQTHMASYHHHHGGGYTQNTYDHTNMHTMAKHEPSQTYPQPWNQGHLFPQTQPQPQPHVQPHQYPDSMYYRSSMNTNTIAPTDSTIYTHPHPHSYHTNQTQTYSPPRHPTEYQTHAINSIPDSWKGPDKQALLETLLETITSCDEERVAQVVAVVRTSETPEEAVSGICRVLGISGNGADLPM